MPAKRRCLPARRCWIAYFAVWVGLCRLVSPPLAGAALSQEGHREAMGAEEGAAVGGGAGIVTNLPLSLPILAFTTSSLYNIAIKMY